MMSSALPPVTLCFVVAQSAIFMGELMPGDTETISCCNSNSNTNSNHSTTLQYFSPS